LDWDGVLCNSLDMYFEFYRESCRRFHKPFPIADLDQFRDWYNPQWEENYYELGFSKEEFGQVTEFWQAEMQYSRAQLFPHVAENLRRWSQEAPLAIVSTTPSSMIRERLRADDLERYFAHFTGGEDGDTEKRDKVRATLAALGAERGVMVGDTPLDIDAGRHSRLSTVGVTYGWVTPERMRATEPTRLVDDPAQLGKAVLEVFRL
jgi:phosphoglycolate phosphatase